MGLRLAWLGIGVVEQAGATNYEAATKKVFEYIYETQNSVPRVGTGKGLGEYSRVNCFPEHVSA